MGEKTGGRMVGTGSSTMELIMGSLSGLAFGLVSPLASQPFDTLKTKMQAEARYARQGMGAVATHILKADGAAGLYRGILPIVMSTGVQKSALFSANAGARRACEESGVPALTGGLAPVLVGGLAAGTARAVVETPFELAKVRYQTGGGVQLAELYTGAGATWARGTLMLTSFFVLCDYSERAAPELMSRPLLGGFLKGGVCATLAWAVAWPLAAVWKSKFYGAFDATPARWRGDAGSSPLDRARLEVAKNNVQGAEAQKGRSTLAIVRQLAASDGLRGLYRGFLPGALRSFVANGAGMAVFQFTQSLRKD